MAAILLLNIKMNIKMNIEMNVKRMFHTCSPTLRNVAYHLGKAYYGMYSTLIYTYVLILSLNW